MMLSMEGFAMLNSQRICFGKKRWLTGLRVRVSEPAELLVYIFMGYSVFLSCCVYIWLQVWI